MSNEVCPSCDIGWLLRTERESIVPFNGRKVVYRQSFAECDRCGESVVLPDQAEGNDLRFELAKESPSPAWGALLVWGYVVAQFGIGVPLGFLVGWLFFVWGFR